MSSVRMCDNVKCKALFSENDDGWSTDSRNVQRRNQDGSSYTVKMQIDLCAGCVGTPDGTVTSPRLAETAGALPRSGDLATGIAAAEAEDTRADVTLLKLRMDEVEQRVGLRPTVPTHPVPPSYTGPGATYGSTR